MLIAMILVHKVRVMNLKLFLITRVYICKVYVSICICCVLFTS